MAERNLAQDLALARQVLRGPEAMKARVRMRLAAEAGVPPNAGSELPPHASAPAPGKRLLRGLRSRPGLATVTLLMGLSFGAGFWLGQHPNTTSSGGELPGAATTRAQLPNGEAALAASRSAAAAPASSDPVAPNASGTAPAAVRSTPVPAAAQKAQGAVRATRARGVARSPGAAVLRESRWRAAVEGREADALAGEVALLERTERAIRKGDAALALGLLAELDEQFPAAALPEERQAARVLAGCVHRITNGEPTEAAALAEHFLEESPASVYAARIREACSSPPSAIGSRRLAEPVPGGH